MPPKKAEPPAAAKAPPPGEDAEKELTETELLLSFLRSKLGRWGGAGGVFAARGPRRQVGWPCRVLHEPQHAPSAARVGQGPHGVAAARAHARTQSAALCRCSAHLRAPPAPAGRYQEQGERLQAENFKLADELEASRRAARRAPGHAALFLAPAAPTLLAPAPRPERNTRARARALPIKHPPTAAPPHAPRAG